MTDPGNYFLCCRSLMVMQWDIFWWGREGGKSEGGGSQLVLITTNLFRYVQLMYYIYQSFTQ